MATNLRICNSCGPLVHSRYLLSVPPLRVFAMPSKIVLRVFLTLFLGLLTFASTHASPLTIGDPSFEGIALGSGGFTSGTYAPSSWNSNTNAGIFRPDASSYPGGVPDGVNIAYSNSAVIDQVLSATLTASTIYTLSVDVGNRLDAPHNDGYTIQLLAGGVVLNGTTNFPGPAQGQFALATDAYTAGEADPHLGQALEIRLFSSATGQASFDKVTLDASPVPEPSGLALLAVAAACIVVVQRRPFGTLFKAPGGRF